MPTDSRTRSSGTSSCEPAVDACVIAPGYSISDSTPPNDSARMKTSVRDQKACAACGRREVVSCVGAAAHPYRDHAAECAQLPLALLEAGVAGQPWVEHGVDRG